MSKQFDLAWLANYEQRHAKNHGQASSSQSEQTVRNDALAKAQRKESNAGRFRVGIVSFRRRLIDPDNLCGKYFLDCLRQWKAIPDDTATLIEYAIRQERVATKSEERTEILLTPI